jgi:hypothetical protein
MFEEAQDVTEQMTNSNAAVAANKPAMAQAPNTAANAANTASNSMAVGSGADKLRKESAPKDQPGYSLDGVDAAQPSAAAPVAAAPPPPVADKNETAESAKSVAAAKAKDDQRARTLSKKKGEDIELNRQAQNTSRTQAGGVAKPQPGPSRNAQQNFPNRADNTFELYEEKRISGKGFQRRNNVWYDNSYRGQATTNVRRGTDEYRKLDGGLRSIAESLAGVVVVMWEGKAFRIQ